MDDNTLKAATDGFNLPHDIVTLPTGGVFYKTKKKSVKVGYLTANDENIMINSVQSNRDNLVINLIRNKLYEHDLKPEDLLESDVEAILLFLRNTSFGPEYNVTLKDPKTEKSFNATILLDEINIKKAEHKPDENGFLTTTLPRTNVLVKLKPLTYGDIIDIEKMTDQYPVERVAPKITWRLGKQIQEVNGETDKGYIAKFIDNLPIMDSKYIRKFLNENIPSLDLRKQILAPSGEMVNVDITFGVDFFRPFF